MSCGARGPGPGASAALGKAGDAAPASSIWRRLSSMARICSSTSLSKSEVLGLVAGAGASRISFPRGEKSCIIGARSGYSRPEGAFRGRGRSSAGSNKCAGGPGGTTLGGGRTERMASGFVPKSLWQWSEFVSTEIGFPILHSVPERIELSIRPGRTFRSFILCVSLSPAVPFVALAATKRAKPRSQKIQMWDSGAHVRAILCAFDRSIVNHYHALCTATVLSSPHLFYKHALPPYACPYPATPLKMVTYE